MQTTETLCCASWNIHRGRGGDGRVDADRILGVLGRDIAPLRPDILVLQEADTDCPPHSAVLGRDRIEAATGLRSLHTGPGLRWGPQSDGFLGVIVLVHPRIIVRRADVIDLPGHCHRGAVVADLAPRGMHTLRLVATHLSLAQWLRAVQMRTIGQHLIRRDVAGTPTPDTVIVGDLNEWRPWSGLALSRRITGRRWHGAARATFPVGRPVLPLDRILCDRPGVVRDVRVPDSAGIRAASDHRPLVARLAVPRRPLSDA
ncbi:endonuclease/exonuclease/phosphatase family protein [Oceaniglobus indicus]|uniref:endonuclease/exonuclease/phosphatase family protein n=1 Tax=Oceaniglobus indicus TaxID=2047749 RepID=UPI000C18BE29|nr:endonuclease/exonuclease/phosphatase family protein [Oceaniglobus indicus]